MPAVPSPRRRWRLASLVSVGLLTASLGIPAGASASAPKGSAASSAALRPHASGVVLVGFRPGTGSADRSALRASVRASARALTPADPSAERWTLPSEADLGPALAALARDPRVRYAEPDYLVTRADVSNDPSYLDGSLWGMHGDGIAGGANPYGTGADEAWAAGYTGSRSVVVGVIDEGIQFAHPDLAANVWTNPGEIAGNGIDDDANGYVDDVHGWDFFNKDGSVYDGTSTAGYDQHGTHVSGTIGGIGGNGAGVAGVNWKVTIVSAKFLGPNGGYISDAVTAADYLTMLKRTKGLNIVASSNSWGGGGFSQAMLDAIDRGGDAGILFVAAAGNSSSNNDAMDNFPSNYRCTNGGSRGWDCVVAVAAIDSAGGLAYFSSYGATSVDLGAPGLDVVSTYPTNTYGTLSGTSMATPHVSGAIALCASIDPTLRAADLKDAVTVMVAPTASLAGTTASGGRLDVGAMVRFCVPSTGAPNGTVTGVSATTGSTDRMTLAWTDGVSGEKELQVAQATASGGVCGTFATVASVVPGSSGYVVRGLAPSTDYCFQVRGASDWSGGTATAWSAVAMARTADPPPPYACTPIAFAWVDPAGGANLGLGDDTAVVRTLPFAFTSYGTSYTQASVASNGYIALGSTTASYYVNLPIPSMSAPNALLAPAWDDWNPAGGGSVTVKTIGTVPNQSWVVTWLGVPEYGVTGAVSFQAILDQSGDVRFQYLDMVAGGMSWDAGASATVGIESPTGEWGTQLGYNQAVVPDGTAIRCTQGSGGAGGSGGGATPVAPTITTTTFGDATVGTTYGAAAGASGGVGPYAWTLDSGSLPAGTTLSASSGEIRGVPSASGTASFTLRVTGADGGTATKASSIAVYSMPAVTTASLAAGAAGTSYSATLAASGGKSPYSWALDSTAGTLPAGLSVSAGGGLTGTPTVAGTFTPRVRVTDAGGRVAVRTLTLSVAFGKRTPANSGKLAKGATTATLSWYEQLGASGYYYCYATTTSCTPSTWVAGGGTTSAPISGLALGVTYYWQVQALVGTSRVGANGSTLWRFSTAR